MKMKRNAIVRIVIWSIVLLLLVAFLVTAILFRNNDTALPLIDLLSAAGTPFYCRERESHYLTHPLIAGLCDGLRLARAPRDAALFARLFYRFGIPVPKDTLESALQQYRPDGMQTPLEVLIRSGQCTETAELRLKKLQRMLERAARMQTRDALELLRTETGLGEETGHLTTEVSRFTALMTLAEQHPDPEDFFARTVQLQSMLAEGFGTPDERVVLSTIHSAKGLEFDHVILTDVVDGILPAGSDSPFPEVRRQQLEEERRLCYVGVTRAKKRLTVLAYKNIPARFFDAPGAGIYYRPRAASYPPL
jgi:DNA helicase-2/ATP-dependent DNA helicase PcrA